MCKCGESSCEASSEVAQLKNQFADLNEVVNSLKVQSQFILGGHPILLIENSDDTDLFNFTTGEGSGIWAGWGVMGGYTIYNPVTKKNVTLPNWTDRFIVMAGGAYAKGDIGGSNTVSLTAAQNGTHGHNVTDNGHTHSITDGGHIHNASSAEITPSASSAPHSHGVSDEGHSHPYTTDTSTSVDATGPPVTSNAGSQESRLSTDASTTGITVNDASVAVTVSPFTPVVTVESATTGITGTQSATAGVSVDTSGLGDAHENRPPYYAAFYIQKIY